MTNIGVEQLEYYDGAIATFGDRLAAARQAQGLDHKALARRLGVRDKTITAWENDQSEPASNRLQMLAGLLNVSIVWLLTGDGEGVPEPEEQFPEPEGVREIVMEIRRVKTDLAQSMRQLGRLEKQIRRYL